MRQQDHTLLHDVDRLCQAFDTSMSGPHRYSERVLGVEQLPTQRVRAPHHWLICVFLTRDVVTTS